MIVMNQQRSLEKWLDEFKADMLKKFREHDDKWGDASVTKPYFDFESGLADEEYFRKDIIYHFAKWIYNSVEHDRILEADSLVNAVNMYFLLWVKLKLKDKNYKDLDEDVGCAHDWYPMFKNANRYECAKCGEEEEFTEDD